MKEYVERLNALLKEIEEAGFYVTICEGTESGSKLDEAFDQGDAIVLW